MSKRLTIKDHRGESRLFAKRAMAASIIVFSVAFILFLRLAYLQIINHKMYSTLSRQNLLEILPIEPNRGLIYDRNGILLAQNIPAFNLAIIPARVTHINNTIDELKKILPISDNDIHHFNRSLQQHRRYDEVPLKMNLNEQELTLFYVNAYRFPGVTVQTKMLRTYPFNKILSNVVGYVGRINSKEMSTVDRINYSASEYIGKTGIEKYYEKILHGTVGVKEVEINARGNIIRNFKQTLPISGENIYLTIDSQLQQYAEEALGDNNGAIVVIQPSTGQILALVTKPNFDPNIFVNGVNHTEYQELVNSPDHPLFNRAIRGQYSPASTIKPFMAIAGLENGAVNISSRVYDPGWFSLSDNEHIYHDWKEGGHGWVNVTRAIIVSCDIFFYQLSLKLGLHRMDDMFTRFGFGEATQIDMPEELPGLIPTPRWKQKTYGHSWYTGDTILTGIGQGFLLVTPLQLAQAVATIAERGLRYQPHLLYKTQQPNGTIEIFPTIEKSPVILEHPDTWDIVINAMQGVIQDPSGTAVGFGRNAPYTVAAKTGTAQVYGKQRDEEHTRLNIPKRLRNHHLFIVFAPIKNPEIAMAIVLEHAASPDRIARNVMDFYFKNCLKQDRVPNHV